MHSSRLHDAVIRVYDATGNVIETHEHKAAFKSTIATSVSEPAISIIVGSPYALPLLLQIFLKAETNWKSLRP
jgi:hypothetical protein